METTPRAWIRVVSPMDLAPSMSGLRRHPQGVRLRRHAPDTWLRLHGNCLEDTDGDGICDEFEVLMDITAQLQRGGHRKQQLHLAWGLLQRWGLWRTTYSADCRNGFGCNDPGACNYSATALHQSDLCDYESCAGCTDGFACNYTETSTIDDGSCMFTGDSCDDGNPDSYNDQIQGDCSCQGQFLGGCTYWVACNYDPSAIIDTDHARLSVSLVTT